MKYEIRYIFTARCVDKLCNWYRFCCYSESFSCNKV